LLAGVDNNKWILSNVSSLENWGIDLRIVERKLLCYRK